jgi:acid stress chaperone HdeB
MKFKLLLAVLAFSASAAQAAPLDLRTVTCDSFTKAGGADETTVAVWLNGYYMGNDDEAIIDFDKVNTRGNALIKYCADHPAEKLSDAAESIMGKKK